MARDLTALRSTGLPTVIALGVAAKLVFSGARRMAGQVFAVMLRGAAFSKLLKLGFAGPRPELGFNSVAVLPTAFQAAKRWCRRWSIARAHTSEIVREPGIAGDDLRCVGCRGPL